MEEKVKAEVKGLELPKLDEHWVKVKGGFALDLQGTGCLFVTDAAGAPVYLHDFNVVDGKLSQ